MSIEGAEPFKQSTAVISQQMLFESNNAIIAGTIKVKHPLMDETLLLLGFVIEDYYFNQEDFEVKGREIKYGYLKNNKSYESVNKLIYPKIIIDCKKSHCSNYFKEQPLIWRDNESIYERDEQYFSQGKYYDDEDHNFESDLLTSYNYYLYELNSSDTPECAANSIYAICKYRKDGTFKHAIFNLHEITLDI